MTTLDVDRHALRQAVAGFPSVAALTVHTNFPHAMTIEVIERRPVAAIVVGNQRLAVTGNGLLLRDVQDTIGLPAISAPMLPAGETIDAPRTRAQLAVAAAAPANLRRRAEDVVYGRHGLQVDLLDGPPLYFGTPDHAAAKWAAAARVMSSSTAAGATYLDLRTPGRVAAGGLDPVAGKDSQDDAVDPSASVTPAPAATATPIPAPTATPTATPYSQP
jgi:cell division protein FtsQ